MKRLPENQGRWLLPLKAAIILALITGFSIGGVSISRQNYLGYHLYNTALTVLASSINRAVIPFASVLYLFWLVFAAGTLVRRSARRVFYVVGYLVAGIIVIRAAEYYYCLSEWVLSLDDRYHLLIWLPSHFLVSIREMVSVDTLRTFTLQCGWLTLLALLVLSGGILLLRRLRAQYFGRPSDDDGHVSMNAEVVRKSSKLVLGLRVFPYCLTILICSNLFAWIIKSRSEAIVKEKPNIIFIAVDTLRADHMRCYGYARNTSPNIDNLAANGIRFDRAYAQAPWTTASFGSIITSQYPQSYGAGTVDQPGILDDGMLTIAEVLKEQGYRTGAVISNPYFGRSYNTQQGFDFFEATRPKLGISSPGVISQAENMISSMKDRKFFLFLLFADPHAPYVRHDGYEFMKGLPRKVALTLDDSLIGKHSAGKVEQMTGLYDSEIAFTDHYIGLLIKELKKRGLYDDSVIVFLADHGEEFADHGALYHGHSLYNELLHVPLIVKLPNQRRGRVIHGVFPMVNVFPAITRLLKRDTSAFKFQGTEIDLNRPGDLPDEDLLAATELIDPPRSIRLRSIQSRNYKYILDVDTDRGKLFDLSKDPGEQHDIAHEKVVITAHLRAALKKKDDAMWTDGIAAGHSPKLEESEKGELRSLGYLTQ